MLQVEQACSNTSTLCQHFTWGPLTATIFILVDTCAWWFCCQKIYTVCPMNVYFTLLKPQYFFHLRNK